METNWEYKYKFFKKSKYKSLVADYKLNMKEAKDKSYTHNQLVFKLNPIIHKVQGDSKVLLNPTGNIMDLRNNINDLIKTKKKYNYSTAFELSTSEYNDSIKLKIVENLAEVEAYIEFMNFMQGQSNKWELKKTENSTENNDDVETKGFGNLTMKQQLLLLQTLGILNIPAIMDIGNNYTRKGYLISAIINSDDENIRKALSNLDKSIKTKANIKKVNELLSEIGLIEHIIK
ncbi:MAG: hypothetical protein IPO16_02720 [Saprospiraceae bacterium]|nr:hypothetical protein [Saprospiraceae bacterium]